MYVIFYRILGLGLACGAVYFEPIKLSRSACVLKYSRGSFEKVYITAKKMYKLWIQVQHHIYNFVGNFVSNFFCSSHFWCCIHFLFFFSLQPSVIVFKMFFFDDYVVHTGTSHATRTFPTRESLNSQGNSFYSYAVVCQLAKQQI